MDKEQLDKELLLIIHDLRPDEEIKIIKDKTTGKLTRIIVNSRKTTVLDLVDNS